MYLYTILGSLLFSDFVYCMQYVEYSILQYNCIIQVFSITVEVFALFEYLT